MKDDINSYSENISDYVKESNRQVRTYSLLTALALVALGAIGYELVIRINDLINFYEKLNVMKGAVKIVDGLALGSVETSVKFPAFDLILHRYDL